MQAMHRAGERVFLYFFVLAPEPGIGFIDQFFEELDESAGLAHAAVVFVLPVRGAQVFAGIDAVFLEVRKQRAERDKLVFIGMTAVVDNDIEGAGFRRDAFEEDGIALAADEDFGAGRFESLATRIDVDADDARLWSEILAPDFQRAATGDADFHQRDVVVAEAREVSVVDLEIMLPLVDDVASMRGDDAVELGRRRPQRRDASQSLHRL